MKIAYFEAGGRGGVHVYTHSLAAALSKLGHQVTVVTTDDYAKTEAKQGYRIYPLFRESRGRKLWEEVFPPPVRQSNCAEPFGGTSKSIPSTTSSTGDHSEGGLKQFLRNSRLWLLRAEFLLWCLFSRQQIVHFQSLVDLEGDSLLIRILRRSGIKVAYTAHDLLPHDNPEAEDFRKRFLLYRSFDSIFVLGETIGKELSSLFRIGSDRVFSVPHGIDSPTSMPSREESRNRLGIGHGRQVVLFFGLIKPYKGLDYLVRAFQDYVLPSQPNALLLVAGRSDRSYGEVVNLIQEIGNLQSILLVDEYISDEDLQYYFCASDVVALPYIKTYQSGVLFAALAYERPVVVTRTGGLAEVVEEGRIGLVIPPRDPEALGKALITILNTPSCAQEIGRHTRRLKQTRYSWERIAKSTEECYQRILHPEPRKQTCVHGNSKAMGRTS